MTLPVLMAKYNRMVTANRLSKVYSTVSNGIKLSENDNGPMMYWPTGSEMQMDNYWNTYWKPYFVGAELCENTRACGYPKSFDNQKWIGEANWSIITNSTRILFRIADGSIIFIPRNTQTIEGTPIYVNLVAIDINGPKLPNESGRDVFIFTRNEQGGIMPRSGGDCYQSPVYCAELIMQNSWKIPEDYPWIK